MADAPDSGAEGVPRTPGITEVRSEKELSFGNETAGAAGIKRVNRRAEIDTSPPFGSVKEAVTRFGGTGSWIPLWNLGDTFSGIEEFDIKRVEEQTAELEKNLIVKELETLDVLEELGTTKRMVEELKRQLQNEALKCLAVPDSQFDEKGLSPAIKEMDKESCRNLFNSSEHVLRSPSPCLAPSPDVILMELKQAKLNLGKTINDLGMIQTSVESLKKKMKKEKTLFEKSQVKAPKKFSGVSTLGEELKQVRVKAQVVDNEGYKHSFDKSTDAPCPHVNYRPPQRENMSRVPAMMGNEQSKTSLRTAELKLVAARKMEEAARAAEAVALAEIEALAGNESLSRSCQRPEKIIKEKFSPNPHLEDEVLQFNEGSSSQLAIVKKLKEATEEIKLSKQALEDALDKVEAANRKQLVPEDAPQKWTPEHDQQGEMGYYSPAINNFHSAVRHQGSPLNGMNRSNAVNNATNPALRPTTSMRDVLSRKQALPEMYVDRKDSHNERQRVALSQILRALREDLTYPPKTENVGSDPKPYLPERKKFGFIHISLPMTKSSKKKAQP